VIQIPDRFFAGSGAAGPDPDDPRVTLQELDARRAAVQKIRPTAARRDAGGTRPSPHPLLPAPPGTDTDAGTGLRIETATGLSEDRDGDLVDWETWLDLSNTPAVASRPDAIRRLRVHGGHVTAPATWPREPEERIYAAFDDVGVVYVGQTSRPLLLRARNHFANQRSDLERRKAGTWQFLVSAAFEHLAPGDLDRLERSAAEWLLSLQHRAGRRHPRAFRRDDWGTLT
jgi:hypothetical protein